ncbi:MAG TPA: ABC transporter ATP-binding protein [Opitutaceae bacterium]|nr:ABC transporter ATP-binding protein [Opitutaceae bacterium]
MIAIQISQLTKKFGATTALSGVDLDITAGELFALLGPSGGGKTTLLRSLAGFHLPDAGRIFFDGEDVTRLAPHKRGTGMVFQNYALWPHLTVAENVAFGLEERRVPRGEIEKRVAQALATVRMEAFAGRRPGGLSGGQQQRVALARALVVRPRCLLLDEPLSNLDASLRLELRAEIRRVCKEFKLTTVYVTHDQKDALAVSDRLAILDGGRVLQAGAPRDVYRRPASRAAASFIGEADFIPAKIISAGAARATVESAVGRFEGVPGRGVAGLAAGASAILLIRPACWRLGREAVAGWNHVCGRIGPAVYLGETVQYDFVVGNVALKITELNPRFAENEELVASVAPDDVIVLAE